MPIKYPSNYTKKAKLAINKDQRPLENLEKI